MSSELRALREASGLTQADAALVAGVNKRTIQYYETGRKRATPGVERWLRWIYARELRHKR